MNTDQDRSASHITAMNRERHSSREALPGFLMHMPHRILLSKYGGQCHVNETTIAEGQILTGVMFNEPMRVVTARQGGAGAVIVGLMGQNSRQFRESPSPRTTR